MYRVYVIKQIKKGTSQVLVDTRTNTNSFNVAKAAFFDLLNMDFDNRHLLLMSKNNKQINAYRYQSKMGDRDYFNETMELNDE
ncbi:MULTISPECIES: hypothetical protein [unclassified Gilliamella]|uniref:hypothetical protein n=1 Tax=unclassified Gilliamella TaxID=2685620 RepID=UPI00226AD59B|nr:MULTISPECIES: hypothetical protein [unclassified Gilliamella]MCX8602621.1 hypothetical protein [Gilliamella sp. B3722]MCX8607155.1 hypothetical protein [Gilliamella sp. B3771]MCX8611860.1 hypothetical protein [Gilliamella sp. B3891]MCX8614309.1 hypothetical protein [Gilliamella sp. B3773]MCX8614985.1 hypothetical protein [Gilliamella sp. B3770]